MTASERNIDQRGMEAYRDGVTFGRKFGDAEIARLEAENERLRKTLRDLRDTYQTRAQDNLDNSPHGSALTAWVYKQVAKDLTAILEAPDDGE